MTPIPTTRRTLRGRLPVLRLLVASWAAVFLFPTLLAGVLVATVQDLTLSARMGILGVGLGGSGLAGYLGAARLLATLRVVSDLLEALREGDYGMRGRVRRGPDPLQGLVADINLLSDELRSGRRKRTEASRFLGKTLTSLHSPVFVFDSADCLTLANRNARWLIGAERLAITGMRAEALGLREVLDAPDSSILVRHFPAASGRWAVRHATWHNEGREHRLVMLHDMSVTLGEEERTAWQRLLRVLSHELNNSLTPIGSLAGSLQVLVAREALAGAFGDDILKGLEAIGRRADSLARFLAGYGRLARLPPLQRHTFSLDDALVRWACMETRLAIAVERGKALAIDGDEDQLGQAMINLLRNAVDAAMVTGGGVRVRWRQQHAFVIVSIEDDGPGLPTSDSLFVPFFTTKPEGSGIGLSLTRLIVEAHGGTVELTPREGTTGAVAVVRLPARR